METWISDFLVCLSVTSPEDIQLEKAFEIKSQHLPSKIYKHRVVSDYSIKNLETDTVWICSPSQYNDPYDCSALINLSLFESIFEQIKKDKSIPDDFIEALHDACEHVLGQEIIAPMNAFMQDKMRVCSFNTNIQSIVLWAHYANNHKGFCIEYDLSTWHRNDIRRRLLFPVIYSNQLFDLTPYINTSYINKPVDQFNPFCGVLAAIYKAEDWAYEQEWRLVFPVFNNDENYLMPRPSAIYLGARMSSNDEEKIVGIAKGKNIPVYKMKLAHNRFELLSEQYSAEKDVVEARAYRLWEEEGRKHGNDWAHWFKAEEDFRLFPN